MQSVHHAYKFIIWRKGNQKEDLFSWKYLKSNDIILLYLVVLFFNFIFNRFKHKY
jgi:hypothetical protein